MGRAKVDGKSEGQWEERGSWGERGSVGRAWFAVIGTWSSGLSSANRNVPGKRRWIRVPYRCDISTLHHVESVQDPSAQDRGDPPKAADEETQCQVERSSSFSFGDLQHKVCVHYIIRK